MPLRNWRYIISVMLFGALNRNRTQLNKKEKKKKKVKSQQGIYRRCPEIDLLWSENGQEF